MSDSKKLFTDLDKFIKQQEYNKILKDLEDLIPPDSQWRAPPPAKKAKAPQPTVRWVKRDSDGNVIYARPSSSRKQSNQARLSRKADPGGSSRKADPGGSSPEADPGGSSRKADPGGSSPEADPGGSSREAVPPMKVISWPSSWDPNVPVEQFLEEFRHSLNIARASIGVQEAPPPPPPSAANDWSIRKRIALEKRQAAKPRLLNGLAAKENVSPHTCQECAINPAAVRCHDCQPRPFLCAQCDIIRHTSHVLHNRDGMAAGFFQPLPPTTCIVDKAPCRCERLVPVRMPDNICSCPKEALMVKPGEAVAVVTMEGRYDLNMPELSCEACKAAWTAGVDEPIPRNFWPAIHFATLYATDIFLSFNQMKMATPALSCQAFVRMLNRRTFHFGRTGKISTDCFQESFLEWEAIQLALGNIVKKKKKRGHGQTQKSATL